MTKKKDPNDPLIFFKFYGFQYLGVISKYTFIERGIWVTFITTLIVDYDGQLPDTQQIYRDCNIRTNEEKEALAYIFDDTVKLGLKIIKETTEYNHNHSRPNN